MGTGLFNLEYKKQKTHPQKWDGSSLVACPECISNNLMSDFNKLLDFIEKK